MIRTINEIHDKNELPQEVIINSFGVTYKKAYYVTKEDTFCYILIEGDSRAKIHNYDEAYSIEEVSSLEELLKFLRVD